MPRQSVDSSLRAIIMGCSGLGILGLVLSVAHCLEILGPCEDPVVEISRNVTAVLGEKVHLSCVYLGENEILNAEWKRQRNSRVKLKRLAGFTNGVLFNRDGFSEPESVTNLTVQISVSSVEAEGQYICEFGSEEEYYTCHMFLTVVARPDIQIAVNAESISGTHYQSVRCSAANSRPRPHISWLVKGVPASGYPFIVNASEAAHSNGTSTLSSVLRFPTHLQDEENVTCVVQHPTLPNPELTTVGVETYARPNVTIKAELVQRGGSDFWVVSCVASGGRPDTDISLILDTDEELQHETKRDPGTQTASVSLLAVQHQGKNVTCVFEHPKFAHQESRVVTLPFFYLTGVELSSDLGRGTYDSQNPESIELQEGQSDAVIGLQVTGNVPQYNVTCKGSDELLPEGVEVFGSSLTVQGPVELQHADVYECSVSYHHLQATLKLNVTVKPRVIQLEPPTIRVDLRAEDGHWAIECLAADAVPEANVSWLLPEGVSAVSRLNFTSHNGSHSVQGVLLLPACSPRERTALCVINHPAFEEPENRSVALPICARPNITISSQTGWEEGEEYTKVDCSVASVAPAAAISWLLGNSDINNTSEMEEQADGVVSVRSSVYILTALYYGQNLTCSVDHPSLEAPEERTISILAQRTHLLSVSVERQQGSALWLAVCDCSGVSVGPDLAWILPKNAKSQTSMESEYEGRFLRARLTYRFDLALHEGQNLTCVYHSDHGGTEEKTIHIPRYYISSLRILNRTTALQSHYGGEPITQRLTLQENQRHQRVLLRVEGNVPEYNLVCKRSDGSLVQMEGAAMVFPSKVTEQDEGLYACQASFYHHTATVDIRVEVMSKKRLFAMAAIVGVSFAFAIMLVLVITVWVCCTAHRRGHKPRKESLGALTALMREPQSPEGKKPPVIKSDGKEQTQLLRYSIVVDVKSTV